MGNHATAEPHCWLPSWRGQDTYYTILSPYAHAYVRNMYLCVRACDPAPPAPTCRRCRETISLPAIPGAYLALPKPVSCQGRALVPSSLSQSTKFTSYIEWHFAISRPMCIYKCCYLCQPPRPGGARPPSVPSCPVRSGTAPVTPKGTGTERKGGGRGCRVPFHES